MSLLSICDVVAPAKLNLFLHVIGQRDDGYHLLQSVFVLIDWCDSLHFERRSDGQVMRHDLGAALPADDLCVRAARALQAVSGCGLGVDISIDKQVPWGAGMGGGSSDAASTLLALNRLWNLNWPRSRLKALGMTIGADVPFFIGGRNAFVEGIGERLTPLEVKPQWLAVLKPAGELETRAVFSSPLLARNTEAVILESFYTGLSDTTIEIVEAYGRNDLQPPAADLCQGVTTAANVLIEMYGNSRMTGSGTAVFARAGLVCNAPLVVPEFKVDIPRGWSGRMCKSLPQHPLLAWAEN